MKTARLWIAIVQPSVLVAVAMWWVGNVEVAMLTYVFAACWLVPWLLLGVRPLSSRGGFPFLPRLDPGEKRVRKAVLHWLVFGPCMVGAFTLLRPWMGDPEHYRAQLALLGWNDSHFPWYVFVFVVFVPLAEEWWWRGQVLPRTIDRYGRRAGIAITALGFAGYHVFVLVRLYDPLAVVIRMTAIYGAGLFWSWLAARERRWGMAYLGHQAADTGIVGIFQLFFRA
ncbi:MAG: CPBP family intramembrane metalloprotease [Gemmatimonadetes bacterium]|nr:CPBP family intramembrane metalloprotease [Gemmatimonadota bacterium]